MHRKFALAAVAAATALVLAACGGSGGGSSSSSASGGGGGEGECPGADAFCIGLVTDTGKVDDKSFNQSAWEGAKEAAAATGGYAKYIETVDPKDYANNINQFVSAGYDVIVTVGFLMGEATGAAATANPNVQFIGVDQFQADPPIKNLTGLVFNEDKAGYAAGYLAGLMTKTGKIGGVLGTDTVPPVKLFGEGYKAGALAANPNVDVTLVYHAPDNAFNDPEWGAAEAKKQLAQGADIIFAAGGNTGNGGLIEIAKAPGAGESIFCIGVDTDQYFTVPQAAKCLLTSAEKKLKQGTKDLVILAKDGKAPGGNFFGLTGLAPYHDTEAAVPDDVKKKVEEVIAGLDAGTIKTDVSLG